VNDLRPYLACLARGGVVAAGTESFVGLLADARNPAALARLFQLKRRSASKAVALMVPSVAAWRPVVHTLPPGALVLAQHFWPGPLTIALPAAPGLDPRLQVDGTVGVRQPAASPAAELVAAYGFAVTATSANLAGEPPAVSIADVRDQFAPELGESFMVLPGDARGGLASTVAVVDGRELHVSRAGAVTEAQLRAVWTELPRSDEETE
jgi:L-threonylcarbamoyladenylate synthase